MFLKYVFLFCIGVSLFFSAQLYAQESESDSVKEFYNDTISLQNPPDSVWKPCISPFIEVLGKGFLSLNVDFRIKESWAISVGYLFEGLTPNVMCYYFSGKRHRIETGGGFSGGFSSDFNLKALLIHGTVGYRYQKKKGLFFRAGVTPFYAIFFDDPDKSNKFYPFAGISLGYSF